MLRRGDEGLAGWRGKNKGVVLVLHSLLLHMTSVHAYACTWMDNAHRRSDGQLLHPA